MLLTSAVSSVSAGKSPIPSHETAILSRRFQLPVQEIPTKLKEEFFKILPPTIYFFVALHLVMFIRILMLEEPGSRHPLQLPLPSLPSFSVKAVLLADMLPLINRFPTTNRCIYNIAWKPDFWRESWRAARS